MNEPLPLGAPDTDPPPPPPAMVPVMVWVRDTRVVRVGVPSPEAVRDTVDEVDTVMEGVVSGEAEGAKEGVGPEVREAPPIGEGVTPPTMEGDTVEVMVPTPPPPPPPLSPPVKEGEGEALGQGDREGVTLGVAIPVEDTV